MTKSTHLTPDQAIQEMKHGNERFLNGRTSRRKADRQQVVEVSGNMNPDAIVLTCADARVSPEAIFDSSIGDLFVVRNAGNIADSVVIGSIEYAVIYQMAPAVVVLGHTRCGAVTAALEDKQLGGFMDDIMLRLQPAVKTAIQEDLCDGEDRVSQVVRLNVLNSILCLIKESPVIRESVQEKQIKVVGAVYDVITGSVKWL